MNNDLRIKDLYLASYLLAKGYNLKTVVRSSGICWFVFEKVDEQIINKFWSGKAMCGAKAYSDAIRTLKDRIFSEK